LSSIAPTFHATILDTLKNAIYSTIIAANQATKHPTNYSTIFAAVGSTIYSTE